jgi:hypothetical protein
MYKVCVMSKGGTDSFSQKNTYSDFIVEYQTECLPRIGENIDIEIETSAKNQRTGHIYQRYLIMNVIHFYSPVTGKKGATLQVIPLP